MTKLTDPQIDKSKWGPGPWQDEPDRAEWKHSGLPCLAIRSIMGFWCGYAAVKPGHPLHGKGYNDIDLEVHGGLTYANKCAGHICHVPDAGEPDNVWWFGFDCGHAWDLSPSLGSYGFTHHYDEVYRTLDYVKDQTNRLAEQFAHYSATGTADE